MRAHEHGMRKSRRVSTPETLRSVSFGHTASYTYDNVNRLTGATATGNATYNQIYDYKLGDGSNGQYGNMTCTTGCTPANWTLNPANNQLTPPSSYTYDAAGNLTKDSSNSTVHTYQWDAEGRVWVVDPGSSPTWSFTYNAVGDRVQWAHPGGTDQHMFDPNGGWLGIAGALDVLRWGDGAYAWYTGTETYFNHLNNIGTTSMLTNHSGAAALDILYYPWGQMPPWRSWGGGGANYAELPYQDGNTDTNITMFRFHSPAVGRWHSPDPVGGDITNPQSLNRYAYVLNNPTSLTDPMGLGPCIYGVDQWTGKNCNPQRAAQSNVGGLLGDLYNGFAMGDSCYMDWFVGNCAMAFALLGSGGADQCPNNDCHGMLSVRGVWLPVEYKATANAGYFSCTLSGSYDVQNTAGIAAVACTAGEAKALGVEVGGDINKLQNGQFTWGGVVAGSDADVYITRQQNTVALFNTEVTGFLPEYIGSQDTATYDRFRTPAYRGTPGGRIELYDPRTRSQFPGGCVLVGSGLPGVGGMYPMPSCP